MSEIVLLDAANQPVAYTEDNRHIFLYSGEPVAYLFEDGIFSYSGKCLGFVSLGGIYDRNGLRVFSTVLPNQISGMQPWKGIKNVTPIEGIREFNPQRPATFIEGWSPLVGRAFFQQG